jgi:hypothetical protein
MENLIYSAFCIIFGLMSFIAGRGHIIFGFICTILGIYFINRELSRRKVFKSEMKISSIDRSKCIINEIGGTENIDINLSKYDDENQLIILKNKSIVIGYNNFETKKIIDFDSIINVDIKVKDIVVESEGGYTNYHRNLISSITVYIHTHECTEELFFRYSSYDTNLAQRNYNEILKGLNRFKVMLGDTLDTDDLDKATNINNIEKFIPEQIKKYKELLDMGAITESEYESKKKELLSK